MVTRDGRCPTRDIFSDEVVIMKLFYYVWLGIDSMWFMAINIYPDVVTFIPSLLPLDRQCP